MHTPAKGAGPNKGLGGSNPPFSATQKKPRSTDRGFCFSRDFEEIHSAKIVIDVS